MNKEMVYNVKDIEEYASMNDGECAVAKDSWGNIWAFDTGESARQEHDIIKWDYYFSDEAELFQENEYF